MRFLLSLLLVLVSPLAYAQSWIKLADEGGTATLDVPAVVRYGAQTAWVQKGMPAGLFACSNLTFGDPIVGTVKTCERQTLVTADPPAVPACWPKPIGTGTVVRRWENLVGRVHYWYCPGVVGSSGSTGWTYHGVVCRYSFGTTCDYTPTADYLFSPSGDTLEKIWREFVTTDWTDPKWADIMTPALLVIRANVPP